MKTPDPKPDLVRLIVRLPQPVYDRLKERAVRTAVPMAVLVRQALEEDPKTQPSAAR